MAKVKEIPSLIRVLTHNLDFATDQEVADALITKYYNYDYVFPENEDEIKSLQAVVNEWAPYCNELYATTQYEYDPIENYNRLEEYWGDDKTTYGKKDSRATDLTEAVNTDFKTAHNVDSKSAVNAGMKTEHNKNETFSPGSVDTNVHSDAGYDNNVSSESSRDVLTRSGSDTTTALAASNYDETTGIEDNNYTHNTAEEDDNYDHATGEAEDNYRQTTGDAAKNYSLLSGQDKLDKHYKLHASGNIGTMSTQQMIEYERKIIVNVLAFYIEKFSRCFNIKADGLYSEFLRNW